MEQIPGDFCADNLALILKANGVSVSAEHLQLFITSLQANVKLIGQEMKDQKIKKEKREHFTSTNYFRLTKGPPPGCLGFKTQQFQEFLARWAELRVDVSGIIHINGWSIGCKSEGQLKSLKCVNSLKLVCPECEKLRKTLHNKIESKEYHLWMV